MVDFSLNPEAEIIAEKNRKKSKKRKKIICIIMSVLLIAAIVVAIVIAPKIAGMDTVAKKPVIYLYPETDTEVNVSLGYKDKITVSYPEYSKGWNVFAKTNGDLTDLTTGKELYSLYYESENTYDYPVTEDGFMVAGDDVADFLDEKLEILGLNYREREEFIVYWLPILKENKYNYIRFATFEEIEKNMPLNIAPAPDTVIRVMMTFKGMDKPINVREQKLERVEREGFTAVEWGGTEIK